MRKAGAYVLYVGFLVSSRNQISNHRGAVNLTASHTLAWSPCLLVIPNGPGASFSWRVRVLI